MACQCGTACLTMCPCLLSLLLEQVEDLTAVHEAAMSQLENNHIVAITVLQDENDCKIQGKPKTIQQLHSCSRAGINAVVALCFLIQSRLHRKIVLVYCFNVGWTSRFMLGQRERCLQSTASNFDLRLSEGGGGLWVKDKASSTCC